MARGPKPIPDAVKALRGNPGRRRLKLDQADLEAAELPGSLPAALVRQAVEIPDWLTGERPRRIFRKVVEDYLQRRIIRAPDFIVAARWAHYLGLWIEAKEPSSAAGLERLISLERALRPLEDRLGLSPAARQEILRGLAAMPGAIGDMLASDKASGASMPVGETAGLPTAGDLPSSAGFASAVSPLGFLKN